MKSKSSDTDTGTGEPVDDGSGAAGWPGLDGASSPPSPALSEQEQRLLRLQTRCWIGYSAATTIRTRIEELMTYPASDRMPGYAVIAPSFNGKTSLFSNLQRRNNPKAGPPDGRSVAEMPPPTIPVFVVQAPSEPKEDRLLDNILARMNMLGSARESVASKITRIVVMFKGLQVKLLCVDEFGFLGAGTPNQQRKALNGLKFLGNELRIPIVVSTVEEGLNLLQSNPEIANRYEPMFLPRWKWKDSDPQGPSDLCRLLTSFESFLALKQPSNLHEERIARKIAAQGNHILGHIDDLLRRLARQAIVSGAEQIGEEALRPDNLRRLGWVTPTERHLRPS